MRAFLLALLALAAMVAYASAKCSIPNCQTCEIDASVEKCKGCVEDYHPAADRLSCEKVSCTVENCEECVEGDKNVCETCDSGYEPQGDGLCQAIPCAVENCAACVDEEPEECETCAAGYTLDSKDDSCVKNACEIENCRICDEDGICIGCHSGYHVLAEKCEKNECNVENCGLCDDEETDLCFRCLPGHAFSEDGLRCIFTGEANGAAAPLRIAAVAAVGAAIFATAL